MLSGVDESREEWQARIGVGQRSMIGQRVGGEGSTRTTAVADETAPRVAGYQTEHWSGRVDAAVTPPTVKLKARPHLG